MEWRRLTWAACAAQPSSTWARTRSGSSSTATSPAATGSTSTRSPRGSAAARAWAAGASLQPEPMDRAVRTAKVFGSFCHAAHIDEVMPVATSAIRSARNGRELLDRIEAASGLKARVLDEHEEARYGYLAIANSTTIEDGFGIDIGGGSVQAMRRRNRQMVESGSWQLGAVRVSEAFLPDHGAASSKQLKALARSLKSEVRSAEWLTAPEKGSPRAAGIGGTIRNLA